MKKLLLYVVILLIPILTSAQNQPALYKDFSKDIRGIANSFALNDQVNVIQINLDDDLFEMAAVDDNMRVLWRTTLKGYGISCGKFKGKILAVAATGYSRFKGMTGVCNGFLLDPKTGKLELEKQLYGGGNGNFEQITSYYTTDGSYFKMMVRETALRPGIAFSISKPIRDFYQTKNLTVTDYNEKLEPASTFKPAFKEGTFISMEGNYDGDLFLALYVNGRTVQVTKYDAQTHQPTGKLSQDINVRNDDDKDDPGNHIKLASSESDRNLLYFSVMYKNYDKDIHLDVVKFDFDKKAKQVSTEIFDKARIKTLEKSFVPLNKKLDKPDIAYAGGMEVRMIKEYKGTLLVTMTNRHVRPGTYTAWLVENAIVINGYDMALKPKFTQLVPSQYGCGVQYLPAGYHTDNNKLYVIANTNDGMTSYNAIYAELDLAAGKWTRMENLSKKSLKGSAFASGPDALWFKKNVIIPYLEPGGMMTVKFDLSLQQVQ